MKNAVLGLFCLLTFSVFSQEVGYNVFGTLTHPRSNPYSLITLDTLEEAKTLLDINGKYRPAWVDQYLSVKVASHCPGGIKEATGANDTLTNEQLRILKTATADCSIEVEVDYIPQNTLKYNPPRKLNFTLRTVPIHEAKYPGGRQLLEKHLQQHITGKISGTTLGQVALVAIRFQVDSTGQVTDAQVVQSSGVKATDEIVLEAVCDLPRWQPARDANGRKITQAFEFRLGTDLMRCDYYSY